MRRPSLKNLKHPNEATSKARRGGSREAIIDAAQRLFLERGFGAVSVDELTAAASVARRALYNQFASKEEIFREILLRASGQLETAFPPGIETQGSVENVLRLVARTILALHKCPEYLGFHRIVVANSRQFPWIAEEFAVVMEPQTERLVRYFRPSDCGAHPGLPQSDACGSPVHEDAQRAIAVAFDEGS
jgi:TetR/AcrR family transcriptional regulator of autoinduction and epiphytic fitness